MFAYNGRRCGMTFGSMMLALTVTGISSAQAPAQPHSCVRGAFPDYHDQVKGQTPPGAKAPPFKLSQNYPDTLPPKENYPWLKVAITNGYPQADSLF
jgi:hypothetical protein